jgi:hypothetical protein
MGKNLYGMPKKVRKDVSDVTGTVVNITKDYVKISWKCLSVTTKSTKASECLLL